VRNTAKLIEILNQRPKSGAHRSTKLDFWLNEGLLLRLNPLIAHPMVKTSSINRAPCFWCVAKPREPLVCIFCGESFCSLPCEQAFHKNMYGFLMPEEEGEGPSTTTKKVLYFAESPKLAKKRSKKQSEEAIDSAFDNE